MKLLNTLFLTTLLNYAGTDSFDAINSFTAAPVKEDCHKESHTHNHNRYTPIGVMGDHTHAQGEWMFSYRYMFMNMQDNYMGDNRVSASNIFSQGYMVSPTDMQMEMHMLSAMYAATDRLTFMGMMNLVQIQMLHQRNPSMVAMNGGPSEFSTSSSGLGDSSIGALYSLIKRDHHNLVAGLSVALPSANINEKDDIPNMMGTNVYQTLPYPMQLGSGSWGLKPSVTYTTHAGAWTLGTQLAGTIQLDENNYGYKTGNEFSATSWISHPLTKNLSASVRAKYTAWSKISGAHEDLAALPVQTANPDLSGGQKVDAFVGLGYYIPQLGSKLSAEVGQTLWQDLNGPQLGSDWNLMLGLQSTF